MKDSQYQLLVPVQASTSNHPPIFAIPGAGGNAFGFMELVDALKLPNPIYGFQPRGLDGITVPHKSVAEAAKDYLRELVRVRQDNTVHLLGHSFGGWVALELAFRLAEMGRKIGSLVILDSDVPDPNETPPVLNKTTVAMKFIEILEDMTESLWGISESDLLGRNDYERLELVHKKMVEYQLIPQRSKANILQGPLNTFAACMATSYAPSSVYQHPAYFIFMDDRRSNIETNRRRQMKMIAGWKRIASNILCWRAPGNHMTALKSPHVSAVANWIRSACYE